MPSGNKGARSKEKTMINRYYSNLAPTERSQQCEKVSYHDDVVCLLPGQNQHTLLPYNLFPNNTHHEQEKSNVHPYHSWAIQTCVLVHIGVMSVVGTVEG